RRRERIVLGRWSGARPLRLVPLHLPGVRSPLPNRKGVPGESKRRDRGFARLTFPFTDRKPLSASPSRISHSCLPGPYALDPLSPRCKKKTLTHNSCSRDHCTTKTHPSLCLPFQPPHS